MLTHRGFPIEQLAEKSSFIEVAYLLLNGDLPTKSELDSFERSIRNHTMINESLLRFFGGFHHNAHPMAMVSAVVASMSAFYHDSMDIHNPRHREIFAHRIVAKLPTIAAAAYKHSLGQPFIYPRNDLNYCANMLHMFFAVPCEDYIVDPVAAEALDLLFILHADQKRRDHVDRAPCGSTADSPTGHGRRVRPVETRARRRERSRARNAGRDRHRRSDPEVPRDGEGQVEPLPSHGLRASRLQEFRSARKIIRAMCHKVLAKLGKQENPLFDLALKLEEVALKDEYFVARKLYPNVDFYSGIIYSALGIPRSMFTVMFAIARTVGWVAHCRR